MSHAPRRLQLRQRKEFAPRASSRQAVVSVTVGDGTETDSSRTWPSCVIFSDEGKALNEITPHAVASKGSPCAVDHRGGSIR